MMLFPGNIYRHATALCLASVLMTGCSGMFDGIYDEPVSDDVLQLGFNPSDEPNRCTLLLDARNYDDWIFIDLHKQTFEKRPIPTSLTGEWDGRSLWTRYNVQGSRYELLEERRVDAQTEPAEWDLAIHHFDVRTNGGSVLQTEFTSIDNLPAEFSSFATEKFTADEWTRHQCIVDFSGMFDYNIWYQASLVNTVLTGWVKMDFSTPPPKYEASCRVYLLRMQDGTVAALHLTSYMSQAGTKGILSIDIKYPYK